VALWWLSFINPERPVGDKFLGVSIVECDLRKTELETVKAVIRKAWAEGCNPGGEAKIVPIPLDQLEPGEAQDVLNAPKNTLMSFDDLEKFNLGPTRLSEVKRCQTW
jgi:hypothetical protein